MPPQTTSAGDRFNQIMFLDPVDGYPIGGNLTAPSAGTASGARFLEGAKSANRTIPDPEVTPVTGEDGELYHEYEWSSTATRRFNIELAIEDLFLAGLVQNMPVSTFLSGQTTPIDISGVYVPNVLAIFNRRSKRLADGGGVWSGEIVLNGTLRFLHSAGFTERGAAVYRYSLTPQPSSYNQLGATILDNNTQVKSARVIPFQGLTHPLTCSAIKGNNVATQWTVDRAPIDTARVSAVFERSAATVASVVTSTPFSISLSSAASTTGKRGLLWYEFQE